MDKKCMICGAEFVTKYKTKTCSVDCRKAAEFDSHRRERGLPELKGSKIIKDCSVCGIAFVAKKRSSVACSSECLKAHKSNYMRRYHGRPETNGTPLSIECSVCGRHFNGSTHNKKACSAVCYATIKRERTPDQSFRLKVRNTQKKAIHAKLETTVDYAGNNNAAYHARLSEDPLYYDWLSDPSSYHLDHIIPLAAYNICINFKGGIVNAISPRNLRIVRAMDNLTKSATIDFSLVQEHGIEDLLPESLLPEYSRFVSGF